MFDDTAPPSENSSAPVCFWMIVSLRSLSRWLSNSQRTRSGHLTPASTHTVSDSGSNGPIRCSPEELIETPPSASCWPPMECSVPAGHRGTPRSAEAATASTTSAGLAGRSTSSISVALSLDWTSFSTVIAVRRASVQRLRRRLRARPRPRPPTSALSSRQG